MAQPARVEALNFHTDMPVGEILRRTRAHYAQSLAEVEKVLHIRASQLEAIEEGHIEKLPGKVYAIGFVRSYAEYLGLDADQVVRLFKDQAAGRTSDPALNFPTAASETKIAPLWLALGAAAIALFIALAWGFVHSAQEELPSPVIQEGRKLLPEKITDFAPSDSLNPAMPDSHDLGPMPPGAALESGESGTAPIPAAAGNAENSEDEGIVLHIRENSWVEIRGQDGTTLLSRVLKAGDRYFVPNRPDLSMSLGNAGGVDIMIEGEKIPPLGKSGLVQRDIPLDIEKLKQQLELPSE